MKKIIVGLPIVLILMAMFAGATMASESDTPPTGCYVIVDADPSYDYYVNENGSRGEYLGSGHVTTPVSPDSTIHHLPVEPGYDSVWMEINFVDEWGYQWSEWGVYQTHGNCSVPTETPTNTQTPENTPEVTPEITETPEITPTVTETPETTPEITPTVTQTPEVTPEVTDEPTEEPEVCGITYPVTTVTQETLENGTVVTTTTTVYYDIETDEICGDPMIQTEEVPASPYTWCGLPNSGNQFLLDDVFVLNPTLSQVHVADNLDGYTYLSVELDNRIHRDGMEFEIYNVTDGGWEATGRRIRIIDIDAKEEFARCEFVESDDQVTEAADETVCEDCGDPVCLTQEGFYTYVPLVDRYLGIDDSEPTWFDTSAEAELAGLTYNGVECSVCTERWGVVGNLVWFGPQATVNDVARAIAFANGHVDQWDRPMPTESDTARARAAQSGWINDGMPTDGGWY